jgi:hypothetical protein
MAKAAQIARVEPQLRVLPNRQLVIHVLCRLAAQHAQRIDFQPSRPERLPVGIIAAASGATSFGIRGACAFDLTNAPLAFLDQSAACA